VHPLGSAIRPIAPPVRVVTVDDDVGGPYPPPSRAPFVETLQAGGVPVVTDEADRSVATQTTVIALYGDIRAWKGRPGYSASARKRVRELVSSSRAGEVVVVQFSHPRLAAGLLTDVPVLCAWGGEAVMQRAAARVLLQSIRGA
jgi:hypothetical protein